MMEKLPIFDPGLTVAVKGIVTVDCMLESVITKPVAGAFADRLIVPIAGSPPTTVEGEIDMLVR